MENIEQENYEVSVALLTYMHESYIKQCIDSIISQQTKFKFEIVIGVDFSCDNTILICKEYEKVYSFIKVLEQSKNIGGCDNLFNIISNCVGKYISLVEGDDFWCDDFKLQKQYYYLEHNKNLSTCSHLTKTLYVDGLSGEQFYIKQNKTVYNFNDLLVPNRIHTSSLFFRKESFDSNLFNNYKCLLRDSYLKIILSLSGGIGVIDDVMSCYRKNRSGISSNITPIEIFKSEMQCIELISGFLTTKQYINMKFHWFYLFLNNSPDINIQNDFLIFCKINIKYFNFKSLLRFFKCYLTVFKLGLNR